LRINEIRKHDLKLKYSKKITKEKNVKKCESKEGNTN